MAHRNEWSFKVFVDTYHMVGFSDVLHNVFCAVECIYCKQCAHQQLAFTYAVPTQFKI